MEENHEQAWAAPMVDLLLEIKALRDQLSKNSRNSGKPQQEVASEGV